MNKQTLMNLIRMAAFAAMAAVPGMCCNFSVSVPTIAAGGGVVPITVTTQPGCPWHVTHSAGWMSNYTGQTGSGPGTVYVYVTPDYGAARSTVVRIVVNPGEGYIGGRSGQPSYIAAQTTAVQY